VSLFQCGHCGCIENTALSWQGCVGFFADQMDWTGIEDRRGKKLCSACGPTKFTDGKDTELGKWHGLFERKFAPIGSLKTLPNGNIAPVEEVGGAIGNGAYNTKIRGDK